MVKAKKKQKHFSTPFFKIFYKFWSPYRVNVSIFEKKISNKFFYSKNMFHTISHWLKPKKRKKKFTPFFKNFCKFWSPYKVKAAKTQKHLSTTFSKHFYKFWSPYVVKAKKKQKQFSTPFFKIFYKFWSPYRVKVSIFEKKISDKFFYSKNMFHTISHWLKPKKRKKKVYPIFQKFLQVLIPI